MSTRRVLAAAIAMMAATLAVNASTASTTSVTAHVDIPAFAVIAIEVDGSDVAPFVPAGFATVEAGGQTAIYLGIALFRNTSFALGNATSARRADAFAYSDLKIATPGPDGSGLDSGGVLNIWRLASSPVFPDAMRHLGLECREEEPPETRMCHVPHLTLTVTASTSGIDMHADVPWGSSAYSASASFISTTLPCAVCLPFAGWHGGGRGPVKESAAWAPFPTSAVIGVGSGTVRAPTGSPLFHIFGGREEADGPAILLRGHVDASFALE